jgi:hypothetical protein
MDIKEQKDKIIVRIMRNPSGVEELRTFLERHEAILRAVSKPNSKLLLFDVRNLQFDLLTTTVYVPMVLAHFVRMRNVSDAKLMGCSVVVPSQTAATLIQTLINQNPGKVPTFLSEDIEECKLYLTNCRNKTIL